jgi:hypothetical protein
MMQHVTTFGCALVGFQGKIHWTTPLLSRINDIVKLVGPTISCEGSPLKGNPELEWRRNPHVQSYVAATDKVLPLHYRFL